MIRYINLQAMPRPCTSRLLQRGGLWCSLRQRRQVSSLSPLGTAFNSKSQRSTFFQKPVLSKEKSRGLFGIPELVGPEGFRDMRLQCASRTKDLVAEACGNPPERKRLVARVFDELSDELCRVADLAEFVRLAHPDGEMARAAEAACIEVSGLVERLNTDVDLYESLRRAVESDGGDQVGGEEDVDRHVAKLFLLDFLQCGIHLPVVKREQAVMLNDAILQIGQRFTANSHQPRVVKKLDLPANIRHHFALDGDKVTLYGLQVDSPHDLAREASYRIFYWDDPGQEELLHTMVSLRHDLAELCGYPTFGHRATVESLAGSPEQINEFLSKLSASLKPRVDQDYQTMLQMKQRVNSAATSLAVWDVPHFTMQARSDWFDVDSNKISEFFSLGACMDGLDRLFDKLLGVRLHLEEPLPGELWHKDVYKLAVRESKTDKELGLIYCDFFNRTNKPHQDCHFTIRGGRWQDNEGTYQNPIVVLMLSLPSPGWSRPTLLSGAMVDNLFHEMGHAIHSMLARTKYQHVTGTRCSTDFAEVPSTLMEYFATDPRILHDVSCHYKTGEKLPINVLEKFSASRKVFSGCDVQTQLCYSVLDQRLHGVHPLGVSTTTEVMAEVHRDHHNLPLPPETAWQHRFSHLVSFSNPNL